MPYEQKLLEVMELKKYFPIKGAFSVFGSEKEQVVRAVDNVDLTICRGETMGLVGESGCGKTTLGKLLLLLIKPTSGEIYFEGVNILKLKKEEIKKLRKKMQIVFQDPYSSLNPRLRILDTIGRPLEIFNIARGREKEKRVSELLTIVGLKPEDMKRYPHEFSGGQRQRIAIARALSVDPEFVVLDEPTSALDVSVQAHILNLLKNLQKRFSLTYLFISHDLAVIRHISHRVSVMYLGQIVEMGSVDQIFKSPLHPYTQALISAIPTISSMFRKPLILKGEVPSPINPPQGCRFHPRCPSFDAKIGCQKTEPKLNEVEKGHFVKCHLFE